MAAALLALCLALWPPVYSDATADALVLALIETEQPVPDDLPAEIGQALARLWTREEMWGPFGALSGLQLKSEIEWTRANWQTLPLLAELARLPSQREAEQALLVLRAMADDLDRLAAAAPEWNAVAIATQRAELDECVCFWQELERARCDAPPHLSPASVARDSVERRRRGVVRRRVAVDSLVAN